MIDRQALLSDLQSLLKRLEADLLERSGSAEVPGVGKALHAEYERAKKAERTAQNYEDWRSDAITQAAAAWVLSCVFVRFLEDNQLIDPPKFAGPNDRLQRARDEHELYFRSHPRETDREYLLSVFDELAKLPGTKDVFGPHNPLRELPNWLSGDAAGELLRFFQKIDANTGALIHDFTDAAWDTRFLGDLYQDLSEAARKKYALLQTPEFVEEFILDHTLEPALEEFGLKAQPVVDKSDNPLTEVGFRMIDPACGSGHFLLGSFRRLLRHWQRQEPGTIVRELVQRTLASIHGVDVNPYAVAIARFRLLLAAMRACGIERMADAPGFGMHLVCGDSLLHAPLRGGQHVFDFELTSGKIGEDGECEHAYQSEDLPALKRMLRSGVYHVVVANPPYIVPKDRQLNERYRKRFESCHMKYSLAVPFLERIFRLAVTGGFTGQITANSFMKREFGKKLIESFLPQIDLTHVIDTSGAYIPGHGTPTVILFGRHRSPIVSTVRAVMGIRGEPCTPEDPSRGLVWSAIVEQLNNAGSQSDFVSVSDSLRELLHKHPWSIGGGGASELKDLLDSTAISTLEDSIESVGPASFAGVDDAFIASVGVHRRSSIRHDLIRPFAGGDQLRDWRISPVEECLTPYDENCVPLTMDVAASWAARLWPLRRSLETVTSFGGKNRQELGDLWWTWYRWIADRVQANPRIVFAFVATHNHFAIDRGRIAVNRSAPVIMLRRTSIEDDYFGLLGLLNSSIGCFWMKQVFYPKGGDHVGQEGARVRRSLWDERYEYAGTGLLSFPLPRERPVQFARYIDELSRQLEATSPSAVIAEWESGMRNRSLRELLDEAHAISASIRGEMILMQEDLDWLCYRLFGLIDEDVVMGIQPKNESCSILPGMRAFELLLAKDLAAGRAQTAWFERHSIEPRTALPDHDLNPRYRQIVERRIEIIGQNRDIALIEQPEYKRRWYADIWGNRREIALRDSLLNRLESYFDFDGRMNDKGEPTLRTEVGLISVSKLADLADQDSDFHEVGATLQGDLAFDVHRLVDDLVHAESVPLLPTLRYKASGLRKRDQWEKTWELQREEDYLTAKLVPQQRQLDAWRSELHACNEALKKEQGDRAEELKDAKAVLLKNIAQLAPIVEALAEERDEFARLIPIPPKYTSVDFISSGGARYWSLRGRLDVPKERWVSFPHCEGPDGTLVIAWAGYDHLQLARAISAYFVDIQERIGGRDDPRLVPLLACIIELLPWLKQFHHDIDPEFNQRMDEVYEGFVTEEAKNLNLTIDQIKAWQPPQRAASRGRRRANP
jgi:hypothetical protein